MLSAISQRWSRPQGYHEVLTIGLPLVVSMASVTVMQFTDRVFLGNYSVDAIAASLPAGIANFLFIAFFMGVATYTNVFVAQYTGAQAHRRVGAALWQGIYFTLIAGVLMACLYFPAPAVFGATGHSPEVIPLEVTYFRILCLGSGVSLVGIALSTFFSGRGLTRPIMIVNMIGALLNIPLDYAMINGVWGFPEMGIAGAGLATVIGWCFITGLFVLLIFNRGNEKLYAVRSAWRFDKELFSRLMKFGLPGGVQFFLDIMAITFFVFVVGRLGKSELAATNIVFSLNTLAFLPMIGLHVAIETLVGQAIGRGRPTDGVEATRSTMHITFAYMALVAVIFVVAPEPLLALFRSRDFTPEQYAGISEQGVILLRFVALYCLVDAVNIVFSGAIKGAGDTRFVMWAVAIISIFVLILPLYILVEVYGAGLYPAWVIISVYICILAATFYWRFKGGKWQKMRVIEATAAKP